MGGRDDFGVEGAQLPLVGRDDECHQLRGVLEAARRRGHAAALVTGEPGIGKTRLLGDLIAHARATGWCVLAGGCDPLGTTRPFGPLLEALASAPATTAAARTAANLLSAPAGDVASPLPVLAGTGVRALIEAVVLDAIEDALTHTPVLLAVDDVHWADRASLAALAALRRRRRGRLAVAMTRRSPVSLGADVSLLLDDALAGSTAVVELGPLGAEAVQRLTAAAGADDPAMAVRAERAGGNPLYIRALLEQAPHGAEPPRTLERLVLGRLESLEPEARDLLRIASALGTRFPVDELAAASARSVVALVGPITALVDAGLLVETADGFAFRHQVVREAVYDHLPAPIRATLHGEIARSLEATGAEALTVAVHVARAPAADAATGAWLHETARSIAATAPELAVELLQRVVGLPSIDEHHRTRAQLDLADALAWSGDPSGAATLLDTLIATAGDTVLAQQAVLARTRVHVIAGTPRAAIAELRMAAARAATETERASLLAHEAASQMFLGAAREIEAPAREALRLLDRTGDNPLARSLATMALAAERGRMAHLGDAIDLYEQSVAAADAVDAANRLIPTLLLSLFLLQAGDHDDGEAALRACDELVAGTTTWAEGAVATVRSTQAFLLGRWDEALRWHARATTPGRARIVLLDTFNWGAVVQIAARRGDFDVAASALSEAEERVLALTGSSGLLWVMASRVALHEARDEGAQAHAVMANAWDVMTQNDLLVNARLLGPTRVRHLIAGEDSAALDEALRVIATAAERAQVEVFGIIDDQCQAMANGHLAELTSVVDRFERLGLVTEAAVAAVDGAWLAARRRDTAGRPLLDRAERLLATAGADAWSATLGPMRRALGGGRRRRAATPRAPHAADGLATLSEQERTIASLVAEGMTNQQVADRLLLGKRTVDTYLWRIFRKLGITSRVDLARLFMHEN